MEGLNWWPGVWLSGLRVRLSYPAACGLDEGGLGAPVYFVWEKGLVFNLLLGSLVLVVAITLLFGAGMRRNCLSFWYLHCCPEKRRCHLGTSSAEGGIATAP